MAGVFFVSRGRGQLIYVGGTVFNNLHPRVQSVACLVSWKHYTSWPPSGGPQSPILRASVHLEAVKLQDSPSVGTSAVGKARRVSGEGAAQSG